MDIFVSDSDWDSSSESGMDDQEEVDFLYGGQAQSILFNLEQSIDRIDDLLSFERGFMPGDVVLADPSGQMGRIVAIDRVVDLENVHGKTMKGVKSNNLLKIRSFSVDDYVVSGPWIGKVHKIVDRITVVFDDGTKYEVNAMDHDKLLPVSPNLLEDAQYPYCPGQRVRVKPSNATKSAGWLCGTWRENQDEGTVCAVEAGLVYVEWIASVLTASNPDLPSPPRLLDSKKLTQLWCFSNASWQLGDWCKLPSSSTKCPVEQAFLGDRLNDEKKSIEEIFEIAKTKTKADVVWQDGNVSVGLDSQTLLPANFVNSYEFWPGQFVLEKGTFDDLRMSNSKRWGVVLGMDAKERTVNVQWKTISPADLGVETMIETVSAYELVEHPDYGYCFGDLVFRLVHNKFNDDADMGHLNDMAAKHDGKKDGEYMNKFPDTFYLSCIGIVTGFKHGSVEVKWATGLTSKVEPFEIFRVVKHESTVATSENEGVEDMNRERIELDKQTYGDQMGLRNSDDIGGGCKKHLWESASSFLPQTAIGFFSNIAASLLGVSGTKSPLGSTPIVQIQELESKSELLSANGAKESNPCSETQLVDESISCSEKTWNQEGQQITQEKVYSAGHENPEMFKQFDMTADCPDHHFLSSVKGNSLSQAKRSWLKKVHEEWNVLEKNLPESIYVRIFEERIDLIRAAIVGAPGTPYHDGLFFFDIYLPPEYPHEPPMVHYNSGGLRLNPNLYESGKVCLSLLNTWAGSDTEVWNPGSTILQVLLSLQALVLNEKPYFNEAGYDQQIGKAEAQKNSMSYNENAYLVTCKSMLYLLHRPPKHFEALMEEHFRRRAQHIVTACKAYMQGAPVGCAFGCDNTEHDHQKGSSTGFKIMLSKLVPKLIEAFDEKGINCSQSHDS